MSAGQTLGAPQPAYTPEQQAARVELLMHLMGRLKANVKFFSPFMLDQRGQFAQCFPSVTDSGGNPNRKSSIGMTPAEWQGTHLMFWFFDQLCASPEGQLAAKKLGLEPLFDDVNRYIGSAPSRKEGQQQ